jgi:hypothetical protein
VVCDNFKAGVTVTCRYEPGINRTYPPGGVRKKSVSASAVARGALSGKK